MRSQPHIHFQIYKARNQQGASLVVSLLMLVVILLLGISAAQIALQEEKTSRNDRDHQIAFQAAEAGLMDAEMDIENSASANSRSNKFSADSAMLFLAGCGSGADNLSQGLCIPAEQGETPVWANIDFRDDTQNARSVPYGLFTGQTFQTQKGSLPAKPPRYIIERMIYTGAGTDASSPIPFYRITAIGFGMRDTTQVVLQTFYRKDG